MKIPFQLKNETIYLTADDNNYCLERERERTKDDVTTTELVAFKWFVSLPQALNKILDMKIKASNAKSLLELKQALESARKEVNQMWKAAA